MTLPVLETGSEGWISNVEKVGSVDPTVIWVPSPDSSRQSAGQPPLSGGGGISGPFCPEVRVVLVPPNCETKTVQRLLKEVPDQLIFSPVCLIPSAQDTWAPQPRLCSFSLLIGYRSSTSGLRKQSTGTRLLKKVDSHVSFTVERPLQD